MEETIDEALDRLNEVLADIFSKMIKTLVVIWLHFAERSSAK